MTMEAKHSDSIAALRIEQVAGAVENAPGRVRTTVVEIRTEDVSPSNRHGSSADDSQDEDEDEPSVLQALSSEQLARRPSFKRILDDLSSADAALKSNSDPLTAAAAATLQAQHAVALQQAAVVGLTNPALLPGIIQNMQNQLASSGAISTSVGEVQLPAQLSVMLPSQHSLQLQSNLLSTSSTAQTVSQSPLIAGAVQTLAQSSLPPNFLSTALLGNMAAAASLSTMSPTSMTTPIKSVGSPSESLLDETTKKREVRLMKNREAARECRRKKKEYVRCLENRVAVLESQNQALIGELRALKELYLPKANQD